MPEQTLNIPGLIAVAVFGFLAIRWLLSSTSAASSNNNTAGARSARGRVDANAVEQVAQMFPQLNRRDIQWDLQMNGGNVAATTERVLSGFGLETPPPSFRPQFTTPSATAQSSGSSSTLPPQKEKYTDLITRYNLSSKISSLLPDSIVSSPSSVSTSADTDPARLQKKQAWSTDKSERARLLQRRREDMILAARRKLEEKDREKGKGKVGS